jgi:hypothetical protein
MHFQHPRATENVIDITVPHIEANCVHRVLDMHLPLPTPREMHVVAYVR